jgi:hypothetical protein
MRTVYIDSIAMVGPGLPDWRQASEILRDPATYVPDEISVGGDISLTPNERRRTTPVIRLALSVMQQLAKQSVLDLSTATAVFASSWGDFQVIDGILMKLTLPGVPVSPVQFHNVVHNTPAGYWSIGARSHGSSTSLGAGEATLAAGLLEAVVCLSNEDTPVVFACYDYPAPPVIDQHHHICAPFAVAMTLTRAPINGHSYSLHAKLIDEEPETALPHKDLERLRAGNPAARVLPLLRNIATGTGGRVVLSTSGRSSLAIDVLPVH